ncbi:hypothetical protein ABZW30_39685 [Kitasatospora sp. NPDC004669]|uniref:hypothetical protein n=1 Tax=Kitasatospora sp. NPDC004669 TaxID=3154555 RepID=UPI0033B8CE12
MPLAARRRSATAERTPAAAAPTGTASSRGKERRRRSHARPDPSSAFRPATLYELRTALSRYGLPGDREAFEQALAAAFDASPIGDLAAVAEVIATYRHSLVLRTSEQAVASLAAPDRRPALEPGRRGLRPAPFRRR